MEALPALQEGRAHVGTKRKNQLKHDAHAGTEEESVEARCWIKFVPAPALQAGMALLPGLAGLLAHQPQLHLLLHPHLHTSLCLLFFLL